MQSEISHHVACPLKERKRKLVQCILKWGHGVRASKQKGFNLCTIQWDCPMSVYFVVHNFYVDDCLVCVGLELYQKHHALYAKDSFKLTKWISKMPLLEERMLAPQRNHD